MMNKTFNRQGGTANDLRILVLEDNPSHGELIRENLEEFEGATFMLDICTRGKEFLDLVQAHHYDGYVVDYHVPDLSAQEIIDGLTGVKHGSPVVMVSSSTDDLLIQDAKRMGVDGFVTKDMTSLKTFPVYLKRMIQKTKTNDDFFDKSTLSE